jgi:AraC family transcriptional regulator
LKFVLPVNPPGERLGKENAVLSGRGTRYYVPDFEGCLSVKSVVIGSALWEAENRRFNLNEDCWLILNDGQHYSITIDSFAPVTTFCIFFERGFVEDIFRTQITPCGQLLDAPQTQAASHVTFFTRIEPGGLVMETLRKFKTRLADVAMSRMEWDQRFLRIGEILISERSNAPNVMARLPASGKATRLELYRRLLRGRDFLLSSLSEPIRLKEMASAACLSPYHFHRSFARAFGETPHSYLTRHRLQKAARLLRQGESSVTEVCFSTGFESPASFSNLFRRHYGVPPSKFSKIQ